MICLQRRRKTDPAGLSCDLFGGLRPSGLQPTLLWQYTIHDREEARESCFLIKVNMAL